MKRTILLTAILSALVLSPIFSQRSEGIGLRVNAANYLWPVSDMMASKDFKFALEAEYIRPLGEVFDLAIPLKIGEARYPLNDKGTDFDEGGRYSLDVLFQLNAFRETKTLNPFLFAGVGGVLTGVRKVGTDFGVEAPLGLGINLRLSPNASWSTKAEYRIGFSDLRNNLQVGTGFLFRLGDEEPVPPPVTDTDGDGVPDTQDLCPQEPGAVSLNGCPDRDSDGIADGNDECPDAAGPASLGGCPDTDGDGLVDNEDECPQEAGPVENKGCPISDRDSDGVPDAEDQCPDLAGIPALNGCPDRDGDGVPDSEDQCPDVRGEKSTRGCPDTDGDGVIDTEDRCPNTAGPASNRGCPELTEEEKEVLSFATQAVQFETGSARLTSASYAVINQVLEILERYPDYSLRIGGHTDSIGSSGTNQSLSERRAKACYDYIVSQGIDAKRVNYAGYGESRPIADNRFKDGREKNRRVEFDIYLEE